MYTYIGMYAEIKMITMTEQVIMGLQCVYPVIVRMCIQVSTAEVTLSIMRLGTPGLGSEEELSSDNLFV